MPADPRENGPREGYDESCPKVRDMRRGLYTVCVYCRRCKRWHHRKACAR